jgi:hypothetical protein
MKIFGLSEPHTGGFATALEREGYGVSLAPSPIPPHEVEIEWEPGSARISDFVWLPRRLLVTQEVRDTLGSQFAGFSFFGVRMRQNPKLKRPTRPTSRAKPRVWLPYEGPTLWELWVTAYFHLDLARSSLHVKRLSEVSGQPIYTVEGIESIESHWDQTSLQMTWWRKPREPGKGMYLPDSDVRSAQIFRAWEQPGWILCTEDVRHVIERHEFTNVAFMEVGNTY